MSERSWGSRKVATLAPANLTKVWSVLGQRRQGRAWKDTVLLRDRETGDVLIRLD